MLDHFGSDPVFSPEQVLENRGRVAIFIDGSNLFYAALQLGIEIDYSKLLYRIKLYPTSSVWWLIDMHQVLCLLT